MIMARFIIIMIAISIAFPITSTALALDIAISDDIAVMNKPIMLRARAGGLFSGKGGVIVELSVDGRSIGRAMTGGDGFALKEFVPKKSGLFLLKARSVNAEGEALILSMKPGGGMVFVDVDGLLVDRPGGIFGEKKSGAGKGAVDALKKINAKFPVVYLSKGALKQNTLRQFLREKGYPAGPIMPWDSGWILGYVDELKLEARALIAGAELAKEAVELGIKVITFEEIEGGTEVDNWHDAAKAALGK